MSSVVGQVSNLHVLLERQGILKLPHTCMQLERCGTPEHWLRFISDCSGGRKQLEVC